MQLRSPRRESGGPQWSAESVARNPLSIDRSGRSREGTSSADGVRTNNAEHFCLKYFVADLWRTGRGAGLTPESPAHDFDLDPTEGDRLRLADARARPVLLHFGSDT